MSVVVFFRSVWRDSTAPPRRLAQLCLNASETNKEYKHTFKEIVRDKKLRRNLS